MRQVPESEVSVNWADMTRLAAIVSVFAAGAAAALADSVSETGIVVGVIVTATLASCFHLEHSSRSPRPVRVRHR